MKKKHRREVRPAIIALMGAVIFLLFIACTNVANLLMVRASLKERELSVRTALGASRWRLMRQTLAESFVIAAFGVELALGFGMLGIHQLIVMGPTNLPRLGSIAIDWTVVAFSLAAGSRRPRFSGSSRRCARRVPTSTRFCEEADARRVSARAQAAQCGGSDRGRALVRAANRLRADVPEFRSAAAHRFGIRSATPFDIFVAGWAGGSPDGKKAFMRDVQTRLAAMPGVIGAAAASPFPLDGRFNPLRWGTEEAQADPSKFQAADCEFVTPGFFETMRTKLIEGRTFTDADNDPKRNVVVIDDVLAKKAFPHESAVGKRLLIRLQGRRKRSFVEVIGLVAHGARAVASAAGREQII